MKTKYYFTFGLDKSYPYRGGWVEIFAESLNHAIAIFREKYPNEDGEPVRCAFYYTQAQFEKSPMFSQGNYGAFCHEVLGEE